MKATLAKHCYFNREHVRRLHQPPTLTNAGGITQTGTSNNSFAGSILTSRNFGWSGQTSFDTNMTMQGPNNVTEQAKGTGWNTYSNRRLKQNIVPLDGSVDLLKQLQPVRFWWADGQYDNIPGWTPIEHQGLYPPRTSTPSYLTLAAMISILMMSRASITLRLCRSCALPCRKPLRASKRWKRWWKKVNTRSYLKIPFFFATTSDTGMISGLRCHVLFFSMMSTLMSEERNSCPSGNTGSVASIRKSTQSCLKTE